MLDQKYNRSEQPYAPKKFATVRGHKMAYIDEGEGTPIIFLHGNPCSSYIWRNVMPHLEGKGRLIAPDLMGYGDSEKLDPSLGKNRYSLNEQYEYFTALIDQLCPDEKAIIVIHDCGSMVGFNWGFHHQDHLLGIAYMESIVAPLQLTDFPEHVQEQAKAMTPELFEDAINHPSFLLEGFLQNECKFTETEKFYYRAPFRVLGEDQRPWISFDIPIGGFPEYSYKIVSEYSRWMGENEIPKLLIKSEPGYIGRNRLLDICRKWKNQTEVTVKGKHFVQETSPDEVGEAIRSFAETIIS